MAPMVHAQATLPNYAEGNWTSWTLLTNETIAIGTIQVCAQGFLVGAMSAFNQMTVSTSGTVSFKEVQHPGSGGYPLTMIIAKNGTILQCLVNQWDELNNPPNLNSPDQSEGVSAYGNYLVMGVKIPFSLNYNVDVFKEGTLLQQIDMNTGFSSPLWWGINGVGIGMDSSGQYIAIVGPYGNDQTVLMVQIWQGVGSPPTSPYSATNPPPNGGSYPSSCTPSLGYVCQTTTSVKTGTQEIVTATNVNATGGMVAPPPIAYPLAALAIGVTVSGIFVYRRVAGQSQPRALLASGGKGRNFKSRIKRAFS